MLQLKSPLSAKFLEYIQDPIMQNISDLKCTVNRKFTNFTENGCYGIKSLQHSHGLDIDRVLSLGVSKKITSLGAEAPQEIIFLLHPSGTELCLCHSCSWYNLYCLFHCEVLRYIFKTMAIVLGSESSPLIHAMATINPVVAIVAQ